MSAAATAIDSVGKHIYNTKLEEAVFKATQSKVAPIKQKHERSILIETWNTHGAALVFNELFKRPLVAKPVVLYKALVVVHKMLRDGHPRCVEDAEQRQSYLESLYTQMAAIPQGYEQLNAAYITFLLNKIKFHKLYPDVGPELSLQKFNETHKKRLEPRRTANLVQHLLDLQRSVLFFANKTLQQAGLNECKLCAVLPCLVESYGAHTMVEALLRRLHEMGEDASHLVATFRELYPVVQKFYFQCSTIPFLASQLSVPSLPNQPPDFGAVASRPPPKKKRPKPAALPGPDDSASFNPFASGAGNPFSSALQPFGSQPSFFDAGMGGMGGMGGVGGVGGVGGASSGGNAWDSGSSWSAHSSLPAVSTGGAGAFSDYYAQSWATSTPAAAPAPAPVEVGPSKDDLQRRIRELEARVAELEGQLRDRDGQIRELQTLLRDKDSGLAGVRAQMEARLQEQKTQHAKATTLLQQRLEGLVSQYEAEKRALLGDQLDFTKSQVEQQVFRFDDPSHMGNRAATGEDLLRGVAALQAGYGAVLGALEEEGDVVGAGRVLGERIVRLLEDAKGAANKLDDPALRLQLLEGARALARSVTDLLSHARQLAPEGKPDEGQLQFLHSEQTTFEGHAAGVRRAVTDSMRSLEEDTSFDLDGLAERELLEAARVIENAAAALRAAGAERRSKVAPGELDVEGSILEAAMAITGATQALVAAATQAQQERIRAGLVSGDSKYHRDPMWTEGLISAAKAVAESTRNLVAAASKAARGEIDDAALIAAAQAVAASTAQLVAATRAKSEPGSPQQIALDRAAAAVTRATRMLVDAAKSFQNQEEQEIMRKTDSFAQNVKAEIEQQAEILRLEKALELQRKKLFSMRKDKYADAHAAKEQEAPRPAVRKPAAPVQHPDSGIDRTPTVTAFKSSREDEDETDVPAYMKKLSSPKVRAAPPDPKSIPKFWKKSGEGPEHSAQDEAVKAPSSGSLPAKAAPPPATGQAAPARTGEWNPFGEASSQASNPFGNKSAPVSNPFL